MKRRISQSFPELGPFPDSSGGMRKPLGMLGMSEKPVRVAEHKVIASGANHGLTAEHWKKIPEWLDNPAAVFDSETVPGRLVFIAPEFVNGSPVRMVVEPNARDGDAVVHLLVNAYDATGRTPFARWIDDGLLRYFSKAKSLGLRGTSGLQLPRVTTHLNQGSRRKIYTDADLVKYRGSELPGDGTGTRFSRAQPPQSQRENEVLTDEAAQRDTRILERAIGRYHGGKKDAEGAYEAAPLPDAGLGVIAGAFGTRLRVFRVRGNVEDFGFFNGVYISGNPNTVYVNESAQRPHLAILGHELVHRLRRENPHLILPSRVRPGSPPIPI